MFYRVVGAQFFALLVVASASVPFSPATAASSCPYPPVEVGGSVNSHTRFVETQMLPAVVQQGTKPATLEARMEAYDVPGVSVAVIHHGRLEWARGWGVRDTVSCRPVTAQTVFQAASISKLATATLALRLVDKGRLTLDTDINAFLKSWQLPHDAKLAPNGVTLRQLLSHTAGLGVDGFQGYSPGSPLPTPIQILDGKPPANSGPVRSLLPAGKQWQYSGGGYVVVQAALADVSGVPFSRLADREVLRPLGMTRSAYAQPPSSTLLANAALAHIDGQPIAGGYHIYPELGPAGLWTTPTDLAKLLMDLQRSAAGERGHRLSPAITRTMLTTIKGDWGLGAALYGTGATRRFGHDGANEGFQSEAIAYVNRGDGVVVLTNGDRGARLAGEIIRAVAADYGWKELAAAPTSEVTLSRAEAERLTGQYDGSGMSVYFDARPDGLFANTGGPRPERLIAVAPRRFRTDTSGMLIEFAADGQSFKIIEGGPPITFEKSKSQIAAASAPLFIRGSMNGWSTAAPFERQSDGGQVATLSLAAGDYQFKVASADWHAADFGLAAEALAKPGDEPITLIQHGSNVRLRVEQSGTYRFNLSAATDGHAKLTISKFE